MIIYNAGVGVGNLALPLPVGASVISTTTAAYVDLNFTNVLVDFDNNYTTRVRLVPWEPVRSGWAHFESYLAQTGGYTNRPWFGLQNAAGNDIIRVVYGNPDWRAEYWNGAAWIAVGTWAQSAGRKQYDIYWDLSAEGIIEIYVAKVLTVSLTGDFSAVDAIAGLSLGNTLNGMTTFSQFLVADSNTINAKVKQTVPSAVGVHQEWTGPIGNINSPTSSSTTFITANAAGLRATYKAAARDYTGYGIVAVIPVIRANRGGGDAPPSIATLLRVDGTDYEGPSMSLSYGLTYHTPILYNNPATGTPWTAAAAGDANLEFGVKSLAA